MRHDQRVPRTASSCSSSADGHLSCLRPSGEIANSSPCGRLCYSDSLRPVCQESMDSRDCRDGTSPKSIGKTL